MRDNHAKRPRNHARYPRIDGADCDEGAVEVCLQAVLPESPESIVAELPNSRRLTDCAVSSGKAPSPAIEGARTELAYVRHAKGPICQWHLLNYLGVRQVDAVITSQQTPLERVREIGAALGVQINSQQPAQLQRAVRSMERPILPPGASPGQERLAELFLKITAEKNHVEPRLAPPRRSFIAI